MKQSKKKRLCWIINIKNKQMKKILFLLLLSVSIYGQTTGTALKAQIDTDITNKTGNGSISKTNVGGNLKAVVDYVDQVRPYKVYSAIIKNETTGVTASVLQNDFGVDILWENTGTGIFSSTASSPIFTANKTMIIPSVYMSNGLVFLLHPGIESSTVISYLSVVTSTNSVAGAQSDTDIAVEIRVYN